MLVCLHLCLAFTAGCVCKVKHGANFCMCLATQGLSLDIPTEGDLESDPQLLNDMCATWLAIELTTPFPAFHPDCGSRDITPLALYGQPPDNGFFNIIPGWQVKRAYVRLGEVLHRGKRSCILALPKWVVDDKRHLRFLLEYVCLYRLPLVVTNIVLPPDDRMPSHSRPVTSIMAMERYHVSHSGVLTLCPFLGGELFLLLTIICAYML
jgi:hypothetical protein